jgi:hypothetical protein
MRKLFLLLLTGVLYPAAWALLRRIGADAFFGALEDRIGIQAPVSSLLDWAVPLAPSACGAALVIWVYHQINAAQIRGDAWAKRLPAISHPSAGKIESGISKVQQVSFDDSRQWRGFRIVRWVRNRWGWVFLGLALFGLVAAYGWSQWLPSRTVINEYPPEEPKQWDVMGKLFPTMVQQRSIWHLKRNDGTIGYIYYIVFSDVSSMSRFVSFYSTDQYVFEEAKKLADELPEILKGPAMISMNGKPADTHPVIIQKLTGDATPHSSTEETFTGAVHLFYDANMLDEQRVELREIFKSKGATLMFHPQSPP